MRIFVQWAQSTAADWQQLDSLDWASLPNKGPPGGMPFVDSSVGWINALNVQGAIVEGYDRISVVHGGPGGSIDVWAVNDDPAHWNPTTRYARRIRVYPLEARAELGGAISTRFEQVIYTDDPLFSAAPVESTTVEPWVNAVMPPVANFRHGVMLSDPLFLAHQASRSRHGWREWTDGVDSALVRDGVVSSQRKAGRYVVPRGTRTYYLNNILQATGAHAADFELEMEDAPATPVFISGNVGTNGKLFVAGSSPAGEPDNAAWPTGDYRMQIDASVAGIDLTFGLLTQGTANGHFARVDTGLTTDLETKVQQEAAFAFPGLKLATTGSVSWAAGAESDRFECLVAAVRIAGHGNAPFEMEIGEFDDFADGPWPAAVATGNAILFGANT
jgi:hypothetical protein